jgi:cytochrome c553
MRDLIRERSIPAGTSRLRGKLRLCFLGIALAVGLAAAGCSQGSYPLDIFYEMHYQQSYKSGEAPRLSPPESAVPWFASPVSTSFNTGQHLYTVNCSICHGASGKGDGLVLQTMINKYGYQVKADPDLSGNLVASFPDGVIEAFMVNGIDVMPNFTKLLSAEERRSIIQYIRTLQQR